MGPREVGADQVGARQGRIGQDRTDQVRAGQVHARERGACLEVLPRLRVVASTHALDRVDRHLIDAKIRGPLRPAGHQNQNKRKNKILHKRSPSRNEPVEPKYRVICQSPRKGEMGHPARKKRRAEWGRIRFPGDPYPSPP